MKLMIPNITGVIIERFGLEPFLRLFNLKRNLREISFESGTNKSVNKYLKYQYKRLEKLRDNPEKYWSLANHLMKSSKSLRLLAIVNVRPNWYKDIRLKPFLKVLKKLNGICYRPRRTLRMNRFSVESPPGKIRWLQDPTLAWRLYLWMLNSIIVGFVNHKLNPDQHGHRPGKGTVTAWKSILQNWNKYPNIYEFDYTKFHDRIERMTLVKALLKFKFPKETVKKIVELQSSYVRGDNASDPYRKALNWKPGQPIFYHSYHGVSQGINTSAILGMIVLEYLEVYSVGKYIGYADDGLILSNNKDSKSQLEKKLRKSGVSLKEEKSRWIKEDNKLTNPLKFLGLTFDGEELRASTHSGKTAVIKWTGLMTHEVEEFIQNYGKTYEGKSLRR